MTTALIVIDVQRGFDDSFWGKRNNPDAEANIKTLLDAWQAAGEPIVLVRHDTKTPGFPLSPGQPGNTFKPELLDMLQLPRDAQQRRGDEMVRRQNRDGCDQQRQAQ